MSVSLQILYQFGVAKDDEENKKVVGFTNLDHLSSKLFSLHAGNGGNEYYESSRMELRSKGL